LNLTPEALAEMVPPEHRAFVDDLLRAHGIEQSERAEASTYLPTLNDELGKQLLDVSFRHPIRLIANALGVPPAFMIEEAKSHGVPVAALVGAKEHAVKQVEAGVDILIAQGTEAGGHCGEVTTMVLVPEVIEAIRPIREVPVLAAGGIVTGRQVAAAIALGAAGAWTGSVWLTTEEAETAPHTVEKLIAASSRDTVRSKSRTGKPSRQLRSDWTAAWENPNCPAALPMPLQSIISEPALRRIDSLAATGDRGAQELATYWVGQGVGLMNTVTTVRDVVYQMAEDLLAAAERLSDALSE
jgi:NAD(P)H-dependent flavin oxidoreductase YrpB (nitropropane dioxygenase family)